MARRPLFTAYAERFGGYGHQRPLDIVFWLLANIADTLVAGDVAACQLGANSRSTAYWWQRVGGLLSHASPCSLVLFPSSGLAVCGRSSSSAAKVFSS